HRRGLARAIGPEEAEDLALAHIEVDGVHRGEIAEALGQLVCVDDDLVLHLIRCMKRSSMPGSIRCSSTSCMPCVLRCCCSAATSIAVSPVTCKAVPKGCTASTPGDSLRA